MRLLGHAWTPETADRWTVHDLAAAVVSPLVFVATAAGSIYVATGQARGWFWLTAAFGGSLLLWAIIDRKLRAQSIAFQAREEEHLSTLEERQTWED